MAEEIRVPDIGDVDVVEIIEILVSAGDSVGADDPLVVIESDKASMEIPAGVAGIVEDIAVSLGDQVSEGSLIATIAAASAAAAAAEQQPDGASAAAAAAEQQPDGAAEQPEAAEAANDEARAVAASAPQADAAVPAAAAASAAAVPLEIRVPDIGDASDVVVIEIGVSAGQSVGADDLIVVVESDKASMEIPAGAAGTVETVHVELGAEVEEGSLLVTLLGTAPADAPASGAAAPEAAQPAAARKPEPAAAAPALAASPAAEVAATPPSDKDAARVYAGPAVRRLARELGVELAGVKGSGGRGRILKDDVKAFVKRTLSEDRAPAVAGLPAIPVVDFSRFGPVETVPLARIRAAGAVNLHRSWVNLPHVTQHEEADVTELEAFRRSLKEEAASRGTKVTPLAFLVKACCQVLKAFPTFNASLDPEVKHFILKGYYHIGFAVDTEDGLVVPVIRDADTLGIWELSEAISDLAEKARTGKLGMNDLQGGTFSISSLGNIGGTGFTPIINAPEVAILGVSRLVTKPVWDGSEFQPRQLLPLSLSYDHRAINGAEAGRFMVALAGVLGDIRRLVL